MDKAIDAIQWQKNIERFIQDNPSAILFLEADPNLIEKLQISETALEDAKEWVKTLSIDQSEVLYVYGVGLGVVYEALLPSLKNNEKRRLLFLEDDPEVLVQLLATERGTHLLQEPQVQLIFFNDLQDPIFHQLTWQTIFRDLKVVSLPAYQTQAEEVIHKIYELSAHKNITVNDYMDGGRLYYQNFYRNVKCFNFLPRECLFQSVSGSASYSLRCGTLT